MLIIPNYTDEKAESAIRTLANNQANSLVYKDKMSRGYVPEQPKGLSVRSAVDKSLGINTRVQNKSYAHMFTHPEVFKGLSVKSAVARTLGMERIVERKPEPLHTIITRSVGLEPAAKRQKAVKGVVAAVQKGMGVKHANANSLRNVVNKSVGLPLELEQKPKSIREIVNKSVGL